MVGDGKRLMRRTGKSKRKEAIEQWRKFHGENFIAYTII